MSRKIQFRALIGLVVVVVIIVGVLVWPAPKEARANPQFFLNIYYNDPPNGATGMEPWIWFADEFEDHVDGQVMQDIGGGHYFCEWDLVDPEAVQWQVELFNEDLENWIPIDPDNPTPYLPLETIFFEWEVYPTVRR